jgi:hypothetical protein
MVQSKPVEPSSPSSDIGRVVKDDHERIVALYRLYLDSPPDSRRAVVDELLQQLVLHLEKGQRLFQNIKELDPQGRKFLGDAERARETVNAMILKLQQSETDDDQALDEFFESLMQAVQELFVLEERI